MKKLIIILILFPLFGSSAKKSMDISIELPQTGYGGFEISLIQEMFAEGWCDFYKDSKTGEYYLKQANFYIETSYDECAEDTIVSVSSERAYSLLIIKGLKSKKKPVKTLVLPIREGVQVGEKHSFRFGRKIYALRAEGTVENGKTPDKGEYYDWNEIKNYKLYLSDGKREQLITTVSEFEGTSPQILWVGDLDGDGKPDFAVRTAKWYEDEKIELFLSSIADKGELVKLADTAYFFRPC